MIKNYYAIEEEYGEPVKRLFKKEEYDENSLLAKLSDFQHEDLLITEYKYNTDGYNTETTEISGGEIVSRHVSEYDEKNREICSRTYSGDELIVEIIKKYDEDQLISITEKTDDSVNTEKFFRIGENSYKWEFLSGNELSGYQISEEDTKDNSRITTFYEGEGNVSEILYERFDERGKEVYSESRSADGSVLKKREIQYKNGLIERQMTGRYTGKIGKNGAGIKEKSIYYEYDAEYNLIKKETRNTDGVLEQMVIYKYDNRRNLTEVRGRTEETEDAMGYLKSKNFHIMIETV